MIELNSFICGDCMDYLPEFPDNYFELAIVDPPYGINAPNMAMGTNKSRKGDGYPSESTAQRFRNWRLRGAGKLKNRAISNMSCEWDCHPPGKEYFDQLFRVSKNQIIWGGNYFDLPPTRGILVWDKLQQWENFSQVEIAWTSFDKPAAIFRFSNTGGANQERKIHPTQKPVQIYDWLLSKFAKQGDKILDTHVGSASSLVSCYKNGFDYVGIEKDPYNYELAKKRLDDFKSQITLFDCGLDRNHSEYLQAAEDEIEATTLFDFMEV